MVLQRGEKVVFRDSRILGGALQGQKHPLDGKTARITYLNGDPGYDSECGDDEVWVEWDDPQLEPRWVEVVFLYDPYDPLAWDEHVEMRRVENESFSKPW